MGQQKAAAILANMNESMPYFDAIILNGVPNRQKKPEGNQSSSLGIITLGRQAIFQFPQGFTSIEGKMLFKGNNSLTKMTCNFVKF